MFGVSRSVSWSCMISWRNARYTVPHAHADTRVWVREHARRGHRHRDRHRRARARSAATRSCSCRAKSRSSRRITRHGVTRCNRPPRATKPGEAAFLRIGAGAAQWLTEAAGTGYAGSR